VAGGLPDLELIVEVLATDEEDVWSMPERVAPRARAHWG
jgi:hypothetical protein